VTVGCRSLDGNDGEFDLVLANIGAGVLTGLAPSIRATGGAVILAGLLVEQAPDVAAAIGLPVAAALEDDGWAALLVAPPG
jgi:ribosomal protein L11 methylase PrmA